MSVRSFDSRLQFLQSFASGNNPAFRAALWPHPEKNKPSLGKTVPPEIEISPLISIPHPNTFTPEQKSGDMATEALLETNEHTGGPIVIHDGYHSQFFNEQGPFLLVVDTKRDPFMAGIIQEGKELVEAQPQLSIHEVLFGLSLLLFGNWGQERYSFNSLKINKPLFKDQPASDYMTRAYLGELIWNTQFQTQSCSLVSVGMQVAGQALIPNITWHLGQAARFSAHFNGKGAHAWSVVPDTDDSKIIVDWTNFPPNINKRFFDSVTRGRSIVELTRMMYPDFKKVYHGFPPFIQEKYPPTLDQYDQLYYEEGGGFAQLLAARHSTAYWNDRGDYLGSCRLPGAWE